VIVNDIFGSMVQVFNANRLLALAKPFGGICLIIMGETLYWLMSRAFMLVIS